MKILAYWEKCVNYVMYLLVLVGTKIVLDWQLNQQLNKDMKKCQANIQWLDKLFTMFCQWEQMNVAYQIQTLF